jgi:hypothetical protein
VTEIDFLIAIARPAPPRSLCTELPPRLNMEALQALARFHKIEPLLFKYFPGLRPSPEFLAHAARGLHLTRDLIAIVRAFQSAQIAVLPHKGPLLAMAAYHDLALRSFLDLDLLIRPADLPRAIGVLEEHGYRPAAALAWLTPETLLRWTGEMHYYSSGGTSTSETPASGTSIDLHWRLTPSHYPVQLDPEVLWRSQETLTIAGADLPTVSPEALVLLLAVHGAKHCWEAIGWVADLAWLLRANPDLGWRNVLHLARETNCERPVLLAASLVHEVMEAPIPTELRTAIQADRQVRRLHARVLHRWRHGPAESPQSAELLRFAALLARKPWDLIPHLEGLLFWPTEAEWRRGASAGGGQRVLRLIRKYVSGG